MGLFQSRPEQPQDWGGLPAEPYNPAHDNARLDDAGDVSATSLGGALGESVTISFSMDALTDPAAAAASEPTIDDANETSD